MEIIADRSRLWNSRQSFILLLPLALSPFRRIIGTVSQEDDFNYTLQVEDYVIEEEGTPMLTFGNLH